MSRKHLPHAGSRGGPENPPGHHHTPVALTVIAVILVAGVAWQLATVLVPFALAVVLAIVLAPLASRVERAGIPAPLGSLAGLLVLLLILAGAGGLLFYQGSTLAQDSEKYVTRATEVIEGMAGRVGLNIGEKKGEEGAEADGGEQRAGWPSWIEKHVQGMGAWAAQGLGGVAGLLGHAVLVLAFTFYLVSDRAEWRGRIESLLRRVGLGRGGNELDEAQQEIRLYARFLVLVSVVIGIFVGLLAWWLGLPTPFAWGLLAGLLEFVPFFGPIIAGGLLALVALATTDGLFAPITILVAYAVLQNLEGYVITPLLYGSTVRLNPAVVLLGVLVFGFIWGPVGMVIAVPMLILLKTLIELVPDTPALDALVEEREAEG